MSLIGKKIKPDWSTTWFLVLDKFSGEKKVEIESGNGGTRRVSISVDYYLAYYNGKVYNIECSDVCDVQPHGAIASSDQHAEDIVE